MGNHRHRSCAPLLATGGQGSLGEQQLRQFQYVCASGKTYVRVECARILYRRKTDEYLVVLMTIAC